MTEDSQTLINVPASVLDRLRNIARATGENMQVVLIRYATERLMYRISLSPYRDTFVLKGAWLFFLWGIARRATRDVDLLGYADNSPQAVGEIFQEIVAVDVDVDDGLAFDAASIRVNEIQKDGAYEGVRIRMTALLGRTRIPVQIDLGFGEKLVDDPSPIELPVLLDFPPPKIRAYGPEASIAEKLEAIVRFGTINTRFKDFFDIFLLFLEKSFEGSTLQAQVEATFQYRGTDVPEGIPVGLSPEFAADERSQTEWKAFLRRTEARGAPEDFSEVVEAVRGFVGPVLEAIGNGDTLGKDWSPKEGWA